MKKILLTTFVFLPVLLWAVFGFWGMRNLVKSDFAKLIGVNGAKAATEVTRGVPTGWAHNKMRNVIR